MTSTDTLYRLSRDLYGDTRDDALAQLATVRLPKRLPTRLAHLAIMRREEFAAGNIRGGVFSYWQRGEGILPREWRGTFNRDTADGQAYVIYSYGTPIAWERADGLRVVPPVSYSMSTARHQSEVRRAWGMGWGGRGAQTYSHPTRDMADL